MSIQEHLNKIRNAVYGHEVRESIAKGIETAYDDASENGNANMEVTFARGTHPNLRSRLEEVDNKQQQNTAQLADKANRDEVTNVLTPKGASLYASLPTTGNTIGDYYYSSDGNGTAGKGNYVWNGTTWYFGGTGDEGYNLVKTSLDTYQNYLGAKNLYSPTYPNGTLNPQTFNGITVTNNYNGTLLINGTVTAEVYFSFGDITLKPGTYTLTGIPTSGITVGAGSCNLQLMDGGTVFKQINATEPTITFTVVAEKTYTLRLRTNVGVVLANALFNPMIRAFGDGTFIKKTKTNLELEQALTDTNTLINRDNALYGKEIVWFGTSIPAGGYLGKDVTRNYPTFIANKFGAIVHNEAIGSSPAHCRDLQFVSAENPHGFNLSAFNAVSRCLSNTQAQMQWAIDHWADDIWGSKPATLSETDKTNILNGSYEVILDKYLTANTFPDLFVFDHGYNDYIYPDNLFNANYVGHEFEPFTYNGAMNFLIRRIYSYNPNAKIVIIGNYDYQTRGGLTVQAQEKVAKRWGIPMFETYKHTGISSEQVYTSFTWTLNGTVYEQTAVASHLATMRSILLPDGIHPHSRPDDLMINRMANAIGNWLSRDITF